METKIYNQSGKESGKVTLPESVFGAKWNADLVHEVVVSMQGNARAGTAHTKDRSEVRGGGKKPWKQKGTGRARHGSRRSPIWTGGGVTFGPRNERDFSRKINRNMKSAALASVLSKKHTDGEVVFINELMFAEPKTTAAKEVLAALGGIAGMEDIASKKKNAVLFALTGRTDAVEKSFRNFGNVLVTQTKDINPVDLLTYKYVVLAKPEEAIEVLTHRVTPKSARQTTSAAKGTTKK